MIRIKTQYIDSTLFNICHFRSVHGLKYRSLLSFPRQHPHQQTRRQLCMNLSNLPIFARIADLAVNKPYKHVIRQSPNRNSFSYSQLLQHVHHTKAYLNRKQNDLNCNVYQKPIALLCEPGFEFTASMLGIWAINAVCVPVNLKFGIEDFKYFMRDSKPEFLISSKPLFAKFSSIITENNLIDTHRVLFIEDFILESSDHQQQQQQQQQQQVSLNDNAVMFYTSGTTGNPKGVLLTHEMIKCQSESIAQAWDYTVNDRLLHVLPLNHIHGLVNNLIAMIYAGGSIEFLYPFNVKDFWHRVASKDSDEQLTVFSAVPTIYLKLMQYYNLNFKELRTKNEEGGNVFDQFRVMISGSASLPSRTKREWYKITGQELLERYGMTETGMILSCPIGDVKRRFDGSVGTPMPNVNVRLIDDNNEDVTLQSQKVGEIQVKGPTVFNEYWNRPSSTMDSDFTKDKWFKTGDLAFRRFDNNFDGAYFIQGRKSTDIIKTGGEKVSALVIEREILDVFPKVAEVAVFGMPDSVWGETVTAAIVLHDQDIKLSQDDIHASLKNRIDSAWIPKKTIFLNELPKNHMGKVEKKKLQRMMTH